jgi:hypothetical protein
MLLGNENQKAGTSVYRRSVVAMLTSIEIRYALHIDSDYAPHYATHSGLRYASALSCSNGLLAEYI